MILQRLRLMFAAIREADRQERIEHYTAAAEHHESKAGEARAKVAELMSEPVLAKMREAGL